MLTILAIVLVLMLLGAIPIWPPSRSWGYAPITLVVALVLVLLVTGQL